MFKIVLCILSTILAAEVGEYENKLLFFLFMLKKTNFC